MSKESALREEIVTLGRSLYDRGLTPGSSGNISARLDDGWLMTPTNACLGRLDPAQHTLQRSNAFIGFDIVRRRFGGGFRLGLFLERRIDRFHRAVPRQ